MLLGLRFVQAISEKKEKKKHNVIKHIFTFSSYPPEVCFHVDPENSTLLHCRFSLIYKKNCGIIYKCTQMRFFPVVYHSKGLHFTNKTRT